MTEVMSSTPEAGPPVRSNIFTPAQKILLVLFPVLMGLAWAAAHRLEQARSRDPDLPVLGSAPDFELVDQTGRRFRRADLEGSIWVADFIFTHCASSCPVMTAGLGRLRESVPGLAVRFVSFTVDPTRDTPAVLAEYARERTMGDRDWTFLTGEQEVVHRLARDGFKLAARENPEGEVEPFLHSQSFVLVDGAGQIRGYYNGLDDEAVSKLARDLARLAGSGRTVP